MSMTIDAQSGSMGILIMGAFAKQLGGRLEVAQGEGVSLSVDFSSPEQAMS